MRWISRARRAWQTRRYDLVVPDLARTLDDRTRPSDVIGPIPTSAGS
jgi:hypothetical protein